VYTHVNTENAAVCLMCSGDVIIENVISMHASVSLSQNILKNTILKYKNSQKI